MFNYIYIILLSILAYYDIKNNKEVPDLLVYIFYLVGLVQATILNELIYFILITIIIFFLHRAGVFGSAEIFVLPTLYVDLNYRILDVFVMSSVIVISYSVAISFSILIIIMSLINPFLGLVLSYLGFLLWRNKVRLYELKKVDKTILGEFTINGEIINEEFINKNNGKYVVIKKSIPYLPILLVSYLLVLYTNLSFLKFLLFH